MEALHLPLEEALPVYGILALLIIIVPILSEKLRIPSIVGLIFSGIIVGHSGLNLVSYSHAVELPAEIGLLYLMFLAGLEIDMDQIRKRMAHSVGFGLVTFGISFVSGFFLAKYVLHFTLGGDLLVGAMLASHTMLTLPLVSRFGLSKTPIVSTIIGGTIITDILAVMVLAVVAGEAHGTMNALFFVKLGAFLAFVTVAILWIVPAIGRRFFTRISAEPTVEFAFVLAIMFIMAFIAELSGVESIIGAIFAGMALNRLIPENSALMNRVTFVGEAIFIPIFLISVGLIIDLRTMLVSPNAWTIAGVMVVGGVLTKYLSAVVTRFLFRYQSHEQELIFGMSITRATATLAAVLVGYHFGIFGEDMVGGTVFMILVTSILGPVLSRSASEKIVRAGEQAGGRLIEQPQRILIAVDAEEDGSRMVDFAVLLRDRHSHEPIHPLNIVDDELNPEEAVARAEKLMTSAVVRANSAGVPVVPLARIDNAVYNGILRAMMEQRISMLIAGWNGERSLYGSVFGKTMETILENSRQQVCLTHWHHPLNTMTRIILIVPPLVDRLEGFAVALGSIKTLVSQLGAKLQIICHEDVLESVTDINENLKPQNPTTLMAYGSFHEILTDVDRSNVKDSDMLVLFSARIGQIAWQPRVEKLSYHLTRKYRHQNVAVIFSPRSAEIGDSNLEVVVPETGAALFSHGNIVELERPLSLDDSIRGILKPFNLPDYFLSEIIPGLVDTAENEPVELKSGIVLLHAHVDNIQSPMLVMGKSRDGFPLSKVSGVKVLIILLGPRLQAPEDHLRMLAAIAREVRSESFSPE